MSVLVVAVIASAVSLVGCGVLGLRYWRSRSAHRRCVGLCHRIADELTRKQEPGLVMERVFGAVLEHTGAAIGILSFRSSPAEPLCVERSTGLPDTVLPVGTRLPAGAHGCAFGALPVNGRPQLIHRGLREALAATAGIQLDAKQNMICIPVEGHNQVRGLLQLISAPGQRFTGQQLADLQAVGAYLDAAVNNARLIETIERQRDAAEALYEVGLTISRFLDLDSIIAHAVEQARRLMGADITWYLDFPGSQPDAALIRAAAGQLPEPFRPGLELPLTGQVARLLQPDRPEGAANFLVLDDMLARFEQRDGPDGELFCDRVVEAQLVGHGMRSGLFVRVGGADRAHGLLCSFAQVPRAYGEFSVAVVRRLANQVLIALNTASLHASQRELAVAAERERLSNELHDNMSQVINGLSLELHGIAKLAQRLAGGAALAARVEDVHAGLADAKATIRQAIFELRLPDGRDLWENVRDFCTRFEDWYDLPVQIEVPEAPLRLPLERQREVLRIIQEALWNVRKHSAARGARLVGRCDAARNRVRVEVLDEGAGSDPNRLTQGQGIDTMLARAARLGATLRIEPLQPRGLVVALEFPAHG